MRRTFGERRTSLKGGASLIRVSGTKGEKKKKTKKKKKHV